MPTALVTGATGFLGARLVTLLVERGWHVRALHRDPAAAPRLGALGAEPMRGDLEDRAALARAVAGVDAVVHAAALFTMWAPHEAFRRANVEGTRNLLVAAQEAGVARFVQVGASAVVMGERRPMRGVTEDAPLTFPSWAPYIATKAEAQRLVLEADEPDGMRTAVVLPPLIWGRGMPMLDGVAADMRAGRFAWPGGGRQRMSTAHVDNVALAAILAAERAPGGRAYFVTDGEDRTLREVMTTLLATHGVEARARSVPVALAWRLAALAEGLWRGLRLRGAPPLTRQMLRMVGEDFTLSDARARRELGYRPLVTWQDGIAAMRAG
jgi:nucleoside-diphosphate-sugar epimerase